MWLLLLPINTKCKHVLKSYTVKLHETSPTLNNCILCAWYNDQHCHVLHRQMKQTYTSFGAKCEQSWMMFAWMSFQPKAHGSWRWILHIFKLVTKNFKIYLYIEGVCVFLISIFGHWDAPAWNPYLLLTSKIVPHRIYIFF